MNIAIIIDNKILLCFQFLVAQAQCECRQKKMCKKVTVCCTHTLPHASVCSKREINECLHTNAIAIVAFLRDFRMKLY